MGIAHRQGRRQRHRNGNGRFCLASLQAVFLMPLSPHRPSGPPYQIQPLGSENVFCVCHMNWLACTGLRISHWYSKTLFPITLARHFRTDPAPPHALIAAGVVNLHRLFRLSETLSLFMLWSRYAFDSWIVSEISTPDLEQHSESPLTSSVSWLSCAQLPINKRAVLRYRQVTLWLKKKQRFFPGIAHVLFEPGSQWVTGPW